MHSWPIWFFGGGDDNAAGRRPGLGSRRRRSPLDLPASAPLSIGFAHLVLAVTAFLYFLPALLSHRNYFVYVLLACLSLGATLCVNALLLYGAHLRQMAHLLLPWLLAYVPLFVGLLVYFTWQFSNLPAEFYALGVFWLLLMAYSYLIVALTYFQLRRRDEESGQSPEEEASPAPQNGDNCLISLDEREEQLENGRPILALRPDADADADDTFTQLAGRSHASRKSSVDHRVEEVALAMAGDPFGAGGDDSLTEARSGDGDGDAVDGTGKFTANFMPQPEEIIQVNPLDYQQCNTAPDTPTQPVVTFSSTNPFLSPTPSPLKTTTKSKSSDPLSAVAEQQAQPAGADLTQPLESSRISSQELSSTTASAVSADAQGQGQIGGHPRRPRQHCSRSHSALTDISAAFTPFKKKESPGGAGDGQPLPKMNIFLPKSLEDFEDESDSSNSSSEEDNCGKQNANQTRSSNSFGLLLNGNNLNSSR